MDNRIKELETGLINLYNKYDNEKKKNFRLETEIVKLKKEILMIHHSFNQQKNNHFLPDQNMEFKEITIFKELERVTKELNIIKNDTQNKKNIVESLFDKSNNKKKNGFIVFD
jgi:hypothetical protein